MSFRATKFRGSGNYILKYVRSVSSELVTQKDLLNTALKYEIDRKSFWRDILCRVYTSILTVVEESKMPKSTGGESKMLKSNRALLCLPRPH